MIDGLEVKSILIIALRLYLLHVSSGCGPLLLSEDKLAAGDHVEQGDQGHQVQV